MKERLIKFLLGLIQFVVDFCIIATVLMAFVILIGGVCVLISPHSFLDHPLTIPTVVQGLIGIGLSILSFFNLLGFHRLLDHLNRGKYFVTANVQALSLILWTTVAGTILSGITTAWLDLAHLKPAMDFITSSGDELGLSITYISLLLIIYLIFKRGIALQNDHDSII